MNQLCGIAAVILLIAFSAVNLFLPYALVVLPFATRGFFL